MSSFWDEPPTCRHGRPEDQCVFCDRLGVDPGTLAHSDDPSTAKAAAVLAASRSDRRRLVLESLRRRPMTACELDALFPDWPARTGARRLSDLKTLGLVVRTGERRATDTGALADVYRAVS